MQDLERIERLRSLCCRIDWELERVDRFSLMGMLAWVNYMRIDPYPSIELHELEDEVRLSLNL
jgi:hypothetical protein